MQRAAPVATASPGTSTLKGIGLMCLALTFFSCLDGTAKYLATVERLPLAEVTWVRFVSQFWLIVMVLGGISVPRLLTTARLKHQLSRSFLMLGSTIFNFLALRSLRMDQTQTIYFLAPFVVALLAGPFLGEWVGWRRLMAIVVGFCGILVVVRPGQAPFEPALVFSLASMLCYAVFMLLTRYLSAYDPPEVTLTYSLVAGSLIMAPFAVMDWVWPASPKAWLLMLSMGFWGGLGHYIFILAYRQAAASTLAPFIYFGLLTHTTIGFVVFGQLPDLWTLVGAGIVIASGIYLVRREQIIARQRLRT